MIRFPASFAAACIIAGTILSPPEVAVADTIQLKLQSSTPTKTAGDPPQRVLKAEAWEGSQTAVIVCDVWDYHHCLNAVRRLEAFAPRLNQVLQAARQRGAIVIHAPSDCMPAYTDHPARQRALQVPTANPLPADIKNWCSRIDEEVGPYPVDQSDGGEDDDPQEHAAWAAKLKSLGRNPGMPWKKQSDLITIDAERDYISDRGDEVWNILKQHGIRNVILTGVHCNMCVLGRPFGLRQMRRNGKHVVLMRDMTDSMYSPRSWPYVDHDTGHDMVLDYVEQYICPTITSDQFLGGEPFRWKADGRDPAAVASSKTVPPALNLQQHWTTLDISRKDLQPASGPVWYRGALRVPEAWYAEGAVSLRIPAAKLQLWLNGVELPSSPAASGRLQYVLPREHVALNDYNLLVIRADNPLDVTQAASSLELTAGRQRWAIEPIWQVRTGDSPQYSNIPLPAKFGIGPDAVLRLRAIP